MAETLSAISTISYVLSGILFVIAIILFVKFRVPKIIGDLSGRTAKASIEKMRESNEKSGIKAYKPSPINLNRGKLTETEKELNQGTNETTLINEIPSRPETSILQENKSDTINFSKETVVLDNGTELLKNEETPLKSKTNNNSNIISIIEDIMLIHTNEVI